MRLLEALERDYMRKCKYGDPDWLAPIVYLRLEKRVMASEYDYEDFELELGEDEELGSQEEMEAIVQVINPIELLDEKSIDRLLNAIREVQNYKKSS